MAIDYDALLAFDIPEVVQDYDPRDAALYALSIGMGQDPLDMARLPYARGERAMPAIANVLGHPGFWLSDPRTGVDATKLLHGEHGMTIHVPLPPEGRIRAKTRVTGIVDKGEGRGAILYQEKQVRDAETDMLLATTRMTSILRADGGFGGPNGPIQPPHRLPDTAPDRSFDTPTRPEQALLYRWNGDPNPLHLDPQAAARAGFDRPILHGLCAFGCAAHALLAVLCDHDADRFGEMDARFTAPVFPGDTLRTEIWPDGSFRTRAVERDVVVIGNGRFELGHR